MAQRGHLIKMTRRVPVQVAVPIAQRRRRRRRMKMWLETSHPFETKVIDDRTREQHHYHHERMVRRLV
jgi:hypothetical protein